MTLLRRAGLRYHLHHPAQFTLAIAGIALGVAVVVAIDLANESSRRAFAAAADVTSGPVTDQIVGEADGVDESLFARLRAGDGERPGLRTSAPVVEGVVVPQRGDDPKADPTKNAVGRLKALDLLGLDPWSEATLGRVLLPAGSLTAPAPDSRERAAPTAPALDLQSLLTRPGAVLVARETAAVLGVGVGDRLAVEVQGRAESLLVAGLLDPTEPTAREALSHLVLADIATAQEVLGRLGRLSRIDLVLPEGGAGDDLRAQIARELPPGVRLKRAPSRPAALEQMTYAFRFNLRALSLLALLCGTFLIYNTTTFSVIQRRDLFARLRILGVRRRELLKLILAEAAVLGLVGSLLGLLLGVVLGRGLLGLVLAIVRDLYFATAAGEFALAPLSLLKGGLLGLGAAVGAALVPALEAASAPPRTTLLRSDLERSARGVARRAAWIGLLVALAGGVTLAAAARSLPLSLAGFFLVLVGFSLAVPESLARALRSVDSPIGRKLRIGLFGRMAARAVVASLSRTGVAVAALTLAVAVSISIAIMIGSFRSAVEIWLDAALSGDLYVNSADSIPGVAPGRLAPATVERIQALANVASVRTLRLTSTESAGGLPARIVGADLDRPELASFHFKEGSPDAAGEALRTAPDAVLLAEPFAYRRNLHLGDRFDLETAHGPRSFRVAGVHFDYGSDQGSVVMTTASFVLHFGDPGIAALAILAAPGADLDALERAVEGAAPEGALLVQSSRRLKEMSIAIFDRTFRITGVLRLLAISVAFLGILAALAAIELERGREFALLRAQGLTRAQLLRLVAAETGWIGLAAGLFSLPLGALLAAIMVHVIQKRSFGWSMEIVWAARPFLEALVLALVAALLAGLVPAWRLGNTAPAVALKEE